ncbi:MAG: hypothetical protein ACI9DK_000338, partial [Vicingaceae bacterium]
MDKAFRNDYIFSKSLIINFVMAFGLGSFSGSYCIL